jgi:hypothetical protein
VSVAVDAVEAWLRFALEAIFACTCCECASRYSLKRDRNGSPSTLSLPPPLLIVDDVDDEDDEEFDDDEEEDANADTSDDEFIAPVTLLLTSLDLTIKSQ